ncbi:helix-turn-helix domain-containing protein [Actinomadura rubrisoli]|uniref:XRE family transcriptional regulator n=1 Tax=Actinomadura rubrisoli TaxID=2530368 RepID=A0A4R5BX40_9ACTN|nr:helix-turn-helix transcriptional regulator [Actinomadura rubrisoli]TDD90759.1 XRE family transcriptional regulator [Actinomadura rubrisoli]
MPAPISSSVQAARQRLADQLKELREDAGLSGRELARRAGWSAGVAKVSRIEHGHRPISIEDLRRWCEACGISEQRTAELLAELRAVAGMWATHRQLNRGGLKGRQEQLRDKYWRVRRHRVYQTKVIPGLLQTRALTTAYLTQVRQEQGLAVDDVDGAVDSRMARQRCMERPDALWLFLLEEDVLWYRPAPAPVHREQLQHLAAVIGRPTVALGIIPRDVDRRGVSPDESFTMSELPDGTLVTVELVSGDLTLTQPYETRLYAEAWDRLWSLAVHGDAARTLIEGAVESLPDES